MEVTLPCPECVSGGRDGWECPACDGTGEVVVRHDSALAIEAQIAIVDLVSPCFGQTVYVVRGLHSGLVKIGITNRLDSRFRSLQAQSPEPLELAIVFAGYRDLEERLHARYADWRRHFEWFDGHVVEDLAAGLPHLHDIPLSELRHGLPALVVAPSLWVEK